MHKADTMKSHIGHGETGTVLVEWKEVGLNEDSVNSSLCLAVKVMRGHSKTYK